MQHQNHQSRKSLDDFLAKFHRVHSDPRPNQLTVLEKFPVDDEIILQAPTGTGKTALGYTFLKTHCQDGANGFYVCPSKTLVDGVVTLYPDEIFPMYGRNEYPCLYYKDVYQADQVPCSVLKDCPHRVNLQTGETFEQGATPCPYLQAKYESRNAPIVACTSNYYFFEALSRTREKAPDAAVFDEAHEWSNSIRRMLSYTITDWRLDQFWELLSAVECRAEARSIMNFKENMIEIIKEHSAGKHTPLLGDENLKRLLRLLLKLERSNIDDKINKAIRDKKIDKVDDREILRDLDIFTNDLYRYIRSLEFALEATDRKPLSFVYGYWTKTLEEGKKVQYSLTIQSYRIAGLTRTKLTPPKRLAMSATIGDYTMFSRDSGIEGKFIDLVSEFPIQNARIFMPTDVPDLSVKSMRRNDKNRTIRQIVRGCEVGKKNGIRSLVIVVSEEERQKCFTFAEEAGLTPISYGKKLKPKEAVKLFRDGAGDMLIGTEAQYGQGIDLPDGICEFIFYLRPGYPTPDSPEAQFEERIYGNARWSIWTWRVILKMLQARGRSIRSAEDKACIFLMSQQFKRFTYGGLPEWLRPAYMGQISFDEAVNHGINLLI